MSDYIQTFRRCEKKYVLNEREYNAFMKLVPDFFERDRFYQSTILNIYYDTPEHTLIRSSLEKPVYKEKLRLRSYGVPDRNTLVFPEIKKKFKGTVYKRRIEAPLYIAESFLKGETETCFSDTQIESEILYFLKAYRELSPMMFLSYDRHSFISRDKSGVRLTFDGNMIYRENELSLSNGVFGKKLISDETHIMELKIPGAMPMWLSEILSKLEIYPKSFSKYGSAYIREHQIKRPDEILLRA